MTIPSGSWDPTKPAGTRQINLGDDDIRELKAQVQEVVGIDHKFETGTDADNGKHDKVSLIEAADIGTGAEGLPILGAQTVSGKAELVFTDEDDNDIQLTSSGVVGATGVSATFDDVTIAGLATIAETLDVTGKQTNAGGVALTEGSAPTTDASEGAVYTKDSGTQPELFYREESSGDEVQVTKGGVLDTALSIVIGAGTVADGGTVPLPTLATGKVESDYNWATIVSVGSGAVSGSHADGIYYTCTVNQSTRLVVATFTDINGAGSNGTFTANYLIIGTLK